MRALSDPQNIALTLKVNGAIRQQGHTGQMMIGFRSTRPYFREFTLLPGDVVLTGNWPVGTSIQVIA
ncbi:MAG: fumarylacetoacetate hydrolase family protein [Candidatus Competibacteraceae bacterium]